MEKVQLQGVFPISWFCPAISSIHVNSPLLSLTPSVLPHSCFQRILRPEGRKSFFWLPKVQTYLPLHPSRHLFPGLMGVLPPPVQGCPLLPCSGPHPNCCLRNLLSPSSKLFSLNRSFSLDFKPTEASSLIKQLKKTSLNPMLFSIYCHRPFLSLKGKTSQKNCPHPLFSFLHPYLFFNPLESGFWPPNPPKPLLLGS